MKAICLLLAAMFVLGCADQGQQTQPAAAPEAPLNPPATPQSADFRAVVTAAKDKVFPAVVYIKVVAETYEYGKKESQEVAGSGVIISPGGEVMTNWHVVEKATEVRCLLFDGRAMDAKVLGSDKDTDLALLQLELPEDCPPLPYAALGDSTRLREGDFVMAMGAPWGLSRSVSIGIISCTNRYLSAHSEYSLWLQTDASICPGNSGGPLLNTDGEVIGLNTMGTFFGGDLGFAVPSATMVMVADQLRKYGRMNWSWTGLQLQPLKDFDKSIYFDETEGVIVGETYPDSPARKAGLQSRDRIVKVNGDAVTAMREEDLPHVRRLLGTLPKDQPVQVEVSRGQEVLTLTLNAREKGKVEGEELDCPRWDVTVKTINQFDNPDLYFHRTQGVFIFGIKDDGNARSCGLQTQDIILAADGKELTSLDDVRTVHKATLENIAQKHRIIFRVLRNGLEKQIVVDISRDSEKE